VTSFTMLPTTFSRYVVGGKEMGVTPSLVKKGGNPKVGARRHRAARNWCLRSVSSWIATIRHSGCDCLKSPTYFDCGGCYRVESTVASIYLAILLPSFLPSFLSFIHSFIRRRRKGNETIDFVASRVIAVDNCH
jgi:hypothetical protein